MINNRQNGRRRGRGGGPQVRGPNGGNDRGNRIDNRARGNAAQLHEKYRNLARDAQTQGDRVMTEYYLQFADHYFRVLSESRSRFDEQNQQQRRPRYDAEDFDGDGDEADAIDDGGEADPRRQDNFYRRDRDERGYQDQGARRGRDDRGERPEAREQAAPAAETPAAAPAQAGGEVEPARPRRGRPPRRKPESDAQDEMAPKIEVDRLPPSFAAVEPGNDGEDGEPAPRRRRTRRPASDEGNVAA